MKNMNSEIAHIYCLVHQHALAVKRMSSDLVEVLDDMIKIVNFIKAQPLNSIMFCLLCENMGKTHNALLLHTEVRWLSKGKVLARFYELCEALYIFLWNQEHKLAFKLKDKGFNQKLAYIADIFTYINETNTSSQGNKITHFKAQEMILTFQQKINYVVI